MNIVLCGMPGAGKTSVGRELNQRTGKQCLDTDEIIVREHGVIADIFARFGERYFRDLETEVAKRLSRTDGYVIATGGGFVLREQNVRYLKSNGKIVYLRAGKETLVGRVSGNADRPLLVGDAEKKIAELMEKRGSIYESVADVVVDTDGKTVEAVAGEILSRLGE